MASDDIELIGPDEIAYSLDLTPAELKVTYNALHAYMDDFGRDERDVRQIVQRVIAKLPPPESIESINLGLPRRRGKHLG